MVSALCSVVCRRLLSPCNPGCAGHRATKGVAEGPPRATKGHPGVVEGHQRAPILKPPRGKYVTKQGRKDGESVAGIWKNEIILLAQDKPLNRDINKFRYEGQCLRKLDMVKKTLRACSLRGGEKTVWRVDCCRRAKKKFGETLTRRARDSLRGVYA